MIKMQGLKFNLLYRILLVSISCIQASYLIAQPSVSVHSQMFINDKGVLFVKPAEPFYLFANTEDSPQGILLHDANKPLIIPQHGRHVLQIVNPENRKESEIEIFADGKTPVTIPQFISGLVFHFQQRYYVNAPAFVSLTSKDEDSGVKKIFYSLANGTFSEYKSEIELNSLDEIQLSYYAEDNVGNKETLKSLRIIFNPEQVIPLENIYFAHNSAQINADSQKELDKLAALLKDYPELRIELMAHTDSRGSASYNLTLSERRAENTKNYLITKGIAASRLVARGYGDTRPVNDCNKDSDCTEQQHAQNRRTEFKIIPFDK